MTLHANDVVHHFRQMKRQAEGILAAHEALLAEVQAARDRVAKVEQPAREELAGAYLPELSRDAIARLEQLTGFRGLTRRDPLAAMARESKVLRSAVSRIEGDERYVRRQYLVGNEGEITRALAEAREMLEPWQEAVDRFEKLEGFTDLVDVGYDTPEFDESFLEARYWRHWAMGDRVCEELGLEDFGDDVLPAWKAAREKRDPWLAEVARIEKKAQDVHDLVQEHDRALARIPRLPQLYLDGSVALVTEFLGTADFGLLDEWLRKDAGEHRAVRMGLRRAAGLKAKLDVLDELLQAGLRPAINQLYRRIQKYDHKAVKYARPKYGHVDFPETVLDLKFAGKADKLRHRPDKLRKLVDRIERYDDFERFDMSQPQELWFAEFTGRRPPSQFPRLRRWYDRLPEISVRHDAPDATEQIAIAAAASAADDLGYLS